MSATPLFRSPVLVTGGAGFIGCNIADRLATDGHDVHVYDALSRPGVERNLDWLQRRHGRKISFTRGDVRDEDSLAAAAREASAILHQQGLWRPCRHRVRAGGRRLSAQ